MLTSFLAVLVACSFQPTAFGNPQALLASLRNTFRNTYPNGYAQFGVLYLHQGNPATDNLPIYDVHNVCGYKENVIKQATTLWPQAKITNAKAFPPPIIWPTLRPLIKNECKGFHPNVATAGFSNEENNLANNHGNAGHSEYYLFKYALQDMLESYIENGEKKCPDAVFLYTVNSPCDSCKEIILKKKTNVLDKPCPKMPFYLGYTKEYTNSAKGWDEIEPWLTLNGITVIQVP